MMGALAVGLTGVDGLGEVGAVAASGAAVDGAVPVGAGCDAGGALVCAVAVGEAAGGGVVWGPICCAFARAPSTNKPHIRRTWETLRIALPPRGNAIARFDASREGTDARSIPRNHQRASDLWLMFTFGEVCIPPPAQRTLERIEEDY
jgi:hypothetical protein